MLAENHGKSTTGFPRRRAGYDGLDFHQHARHATRGVDATGQKKARLVSERIGDITWYRCIVSIEYIYYHLVYVCIYYYSIYLYIYIYIRTIHVYMIYTQYTVYPSSIQYTLQITVSMGYFENDALELGVAYFQTNPHGITSFSGGFRPLGTIARWV